MVGDVLKDKSNVTRSPKRQSVRPIDRQPTNEPPRNRYISRRRDVNPVVEMSRRSSRGHKTNNSTRSKGVATPSITQEDFEFGKRLAVKLFSNHADLKSQVGFEVYSDITLEPLASSVEGSSDSGVTSVSTKPHKGKSKHAHRKVYSTRKSRSETSTTKRQYPSSSKSTNEISTLKTTSFTRGMGKPVEEKVIDDNTLMVRAQTDPFIF